MTNQKTFLRGSGFSLSHTKDKECLGKHRETSSNLVFSDHLFFKDVLSNKYQLSVGQ